MPPPTMVEEHLVVFNIPQKYCTPRPEKMPPKQEKLANAR